MFMLFNIKFNFDTSKYKGNNNVVKLQNGAIIALEIKRFMGTIYCIEHINDSKKYIGSTIQEVEDRWYAHRYLLKQNEHANDHLQDAWNKYGANAFKWWIVEDNIDDDALIDREIYWTKEYKTLNRKFGYNLREELGGGAFRHNMETIQRIRDNHADNSGEKHPMFGRRGENNPNYGKPKSEEHKQRLREANSGEKGSKAILTEVQVLEIDELIRQGVSCTEIAKRYGVTPMTIYAIKDKRSWKHLWNVKV